MSSHMQTDVREILRIKIYHNYSLPATECSEPAPPQQSINNQLGDGSNYQVQLYNYHLVHSHQDLRASDFLKQKGFHETQSLFCISCSTMLMLCTDTAAAVSEPPPC